MEPRVKSYKHPYRSVLTGSTHSLGDTHDRLKNFGLIKKIAITK